MGTADWWTESGAAHKRILIMLPVFHIYLISNLRIESSVCQVEFGNFF